MKRIIIGISLAAIAVGYYCYNNYFSADQVTGTYVNTNYNSTTTYAEMPGGPDTLYLLDDHRFKSQFWGQGTYELSYSLKGTRITLYYKYQFGKASFETIVKRVNWNGIALMLDVDNDKYYRKISAETPVTRGR